MKRNARQAKLDALKRLPPSKLVNYRWRPYGQVIQIERIEPYYGCYAVVNPNGHGDSGIPTKEHRAIADRIVNALNANEEPEAA